MNPELIFSPQPLFALRAALAYIVANNPQWLRENALRLIEAHLRGSWRAVVIALMNVPALDVPEVQQIVQYVTDSKSFLKALNECGGWMATVFLPGIGREWSGSDSARRTTIERVRKVLQEHESGRSIVQHYNEYFRYANYPALFKRGIRANHSADRIAALVRMVDEADSAVVGLDTARRLLTPFAK